MNTAVLGPLTNLMTWLYKLSNAIQVNRFEIFNETIGSIVCCQFSICARGKDSLSNFNFYSRELSKTYIFKKDAKMSDLDLYADIYVPFYGMTYVS